MNLGICFLTYLIIAKYCIYIIVSQIQNGHNWFKILHEANLWFSGVEMIMTLSIVVLVRNKPHIKLLL